MRTFCRIRKRRSEAGIALLIAIFVLLLIGVMAIAMVVSSGTESALTGNYRSSTSVYYAALAGVEEVRARLRPSDPNSFSNLKPGTFLPPPGTPLAPCSPVYVLNPAPGEAVTPWDSSNPYYDQQFGLEFGASCAKTTPPSSSPNTTSVWDTPGNALNGLPFPPPPYKWVRINGVSEQSLNLDTCPYDTNLDVTPVYYGVAMPPPAAPCNPNPPYLSLNAKGVGGQVLELTALAVLPNGSQKLLQYLVAPQPLQLPPFLAALSLLDGPGNSITFHAPASNASFAIKGDDQCTGTKYPAVGVFNNPDQNDVINGIPAADRSNYTGINPAPDVERIDGTFPANWQDPAQLDALAQAIIQNADAVVPQGSNSAQIAYLSSLNMSPTNMLTVVSNGDLDISNWSSDGYGLLLVTGTFTYDPDTNWNGIILVIGQGAVGGSHMQYKRINGAMLVAKTRDSAVNLLATLGGAFVKFDDSMQGNGIQYSSCWIAAAQPTSGYKILSFHEISQ